MRALPALLIAFVDACAPAASDDPAAASSAEREAATAYAEAMRPVFERSVGVAQSFQGLAARIQAGQADGGAVAEQLAREVAPLADGVRADAARVVVAGAPKLAEDHARLVAAWTSRTAAYNDMGAAWTAGDARAFDEARARNYQAMIVEDEAIRSLNDGLRPHGVAIEQYPSPR
jgi:hypothetical protein